MLIPAAAWQRQVSAVMGIEGPGTSRLSAHPDHRRARRRRLRRRGARAHRPHQDDGPVLHPALASARRGGVVHRHRDRRRAGDHADQRRADPRLPGRRQPGVPAAEHHHQGGYRPAAGARKIRQPNVFRAVGHAGLSGPQLRRHRAGRRRADPAERHARPRNPSGCTPGCRPPTPTRSGWRSLLSELERTGAFDRKVLVIIPTTGTGWINPVAARALEMMYNGDTALVGSQYSYLPSWISFLGDRRSRWNPAG